MLGSLKYKIARFFFSEYMEVKIGDAILRNNQFKKISLKGNLRLQNVKLIDSELNIQLSPKTKLYIMDKVILSENSKIIVNGKEIKLDYGNNIKEE